MANVVDRVLKLLALASSSNMNEARNAAYLAAKLIREHGLELKEPASKGGPTPRKTPPATGRRTPSGATRRTPGSKRGVRAQREAPSTIESPLGGDCVVCSKHYRAGTRILWVDSEGGMHPGCFDVWVRKRK
jgi:hypothetical protein